MYNSPLQQDIRKYGRDVFTIELILECETKEDADRLENEFTIKYNTSVPNGYNRATGTKRYGEFNSFYGKHHTEETKKAISESKTGKPLSDEHRLAISKGMTGKRLGSTHPMARKIICVETGVVYDTIKEAMEITGIKTISEVLRGKQYVAGNYHWEYVDEDF